MKKVKVNFVLLALLAAAVSAFAFKPEGTIQRFARVTDSQGNTLQWVPVSGAVSCDEALGICSAQLVNDDPSMGQPITGTETEGKYQP